MSRLVLWCSFFVLAIQAPAAGIRLDAAAKAAAGMPRLRSLLVSHGGTLVLERYFGSARASAPENVKSVSKSVVSALVGIAIERRLLPGVTAPVAPHFPGQMGGAADARKRSITIEDLLTMRAGLESTSIRNYGAWVQSPNWVSYALRRPLVDAPGASMIYSTGNYHLLSAILTRVSGKSTWALANEALAAPLGFSLAQWPRDPQGIYFGGNEMLLTARQMLSFGELYLNRGRAGGRQIVPQSWIDLSFVPRARSHWSGQLYGYGWWIRELAGRQAYYAWGYGGQFIFVVPELHLVVVTTSLATPGDERRGHTRALYALVERLIVEPLARDEVSGVVRPTDAP